MLVVRRDGSGQLRDATTGKATSSWGGDGLVAGSSSKQARTKRVRAPAAVPPIAAAAAKSKPGSLASAVSGLDDMMAGLRKSRPEVPEPASAGKPTATAQPDPERPGAPGGVLALKLLPGLYVEYDVASRGVTALLRCRGVRHAVRLGSNEPAPGGSVAVKEPTARLEREDLEVQARQAAAKAPSPERSKPGDASDPATLDAIKSRLSSLLAGLAGP